MKLRGKKTILGASVTPEVIRQIDEYRGEVPRSRIIERALNQFLEANVKNLQGSRFTSPATQAAPTPTTTESHTGTSEADSLIHMTTNGGQVRTGVVDANDK